MKKFEYKEINSFFDSYKKRIAQAGEDGWEMMSVTFDELTRVTTYYFKKEKNA